MGHNAEARGQSAIVIGENAKTISPWNDSTHRFNQAYRTVLIGFSSQASGTNAIGMGTHTQALANDAMVFGREANSGHVDTIVMGREAKTQGSNSASGGSIAIGLKANAGSADNNRPGTAVGANSYAGASFAKATNITDAPEGLDMSRGGTAIGANAGAAYNIVDLLAADTTDSITKQNVKAGTQVYRHIIRDENNKIKEVKFYTSKKDKGDGTGEFEYSYIDADKVNQGYAAFMGTALDSNEAVLTKAGVLKNGGTALASTAISETLSNKAGVVSTKTTNAYKKTANAANQQVAVGLQSRALGNDAIAVGGQSIAGDNAVVVGGSGRGQAFGTSYVKVGTADLNTYAANRGKATQAKDIDLTPVSAAGGKSIYQEFLDQTKKNTTDPSLTWPEFGIANADSAAYGIGGSTVVGGQAHSTAPIGVAVGISSAVERGSLGGIAIGPVATVEPNSVGAMAMGMGARVQIEANNAIALGTGAEVQSTHAVKSTAAMALGHKAVSSSSNGTALGTSAIVNNSAVNAMALGAGANVTSGATSAIALGYNTVADKANAVALGSESSTANRTATKETSGTLRQQITTGVEQELTYSGFVGTPGKNDTLDSNYFVTVGSDTIKRQIKDVAAGNVSATSTDAINGSQLFSVAKLVTEGWNITGNDQNTIVEAIAPTEKVSFINGNGTTSEVKQVDTNATVTFNVNQTTISSDTTAGNAGKVAAAAAGDQFATAENVANAINAAYWQAAAGGNLDGTNLDADQVKSGTTVTFNAGKNLTVNHSTANNFTFATVNNPEFTSVNLTNGANQVNLTPTSEGLSVAKKDGTPAKVTNLADGDVSATSTDAINGKQFHALATNTIKLSAVNSVANTDQAATSTDTQTLNKENGLEFKVKSADGELLNVVAAGDTVTITPMVGKVNVNDGVPSILDGTKTTTGLVEAGDLVEALTKMGWKVTSGTEGTGTTAAGHTASTPLIKFGETVTLKAGDNLMVKQSDKDFAYSLNPVLTNLTSAEFKNGDNVTNVTPTGVTITDGDKTVSLTKDGLDNGNNPITNVTGNLQGAAPNTDAPTTNAAAPTNVNANNAATVGDVLNAGWNLKGNGVAKDFVKPYDTVNFNNGTGTTAKVETNDNLVSNITFDVNKATISEDAAKSGAVKADKDGDNFATAKNVADAINQSGFTLKTSANGGEKDTASTGDELINPADVVEMVAGKNMQVKQAANGKITYATKDDVEFNSVKVGNPTNDAPVVNMTAEAAKPATNNAEAPTTALNITSTDGKPTQITGVGSTLNKTPITTTPTGTGSDKAVDFVDLNANNVNPNSAATVGDLQNMGWVVSSDKTTEGSGAYKDAVKNANEVKFVGTNLATVSGKTVDGVRQITVDVNAQDVVETAQLPVVYTNAAGDKLVKGNDGKFYKAGDLDEAGNPTASATEVPNSDVIASMNDGSNSTTAPMALTNVKGNLQGAAPNTDAPTTNAAAPTNVNANNAATVGDVLNAGWNLKGNGVAKDFVKPYDTVNFNNGTGTTAKVETNDNLVSNITFDVNKATISEDAAKSGAVKADKDGDNFATAKNVAEAINKSGFTLKTSANGGEKDTASTGDELINPADVVEMVAGKNMQVKQAANGKITYATKDDVEFNSVKVGNPTNDAPVVNMTAEAAKTATNNDTANAPTTALNITSTDGKPTQITGVGSTLNKTPITTTPTGTGSDKAVDFVDLNANNVNPNSAATVGDLQNMGWVVSADNTTGGTGSYRDAVKNANEVKFVGEGTALVSGKTVDGVRTITVKVDDQLTTNNSITPVVYTTADGTTVYPTGKDENGNPIFNTKPDGSGSPVDAGKVITSVNGPKGTKAPTELANVKSHLPQIDDVAETVFNPATGVTAPKADGKANINKAPLTSVQAAEIAKNFANHAATVGDVMNAGWNLKGNGKEVDFVKPFDTVNFNNGVGTTAKVVTDDNLVSNISFDVNKSGITANPAGNVTAATKGDYFATAETVAEAINKSGFTLKTSANGGAKLSGDDELINPADVIDMAAGKNLTVKQAAKGQITYATAENVDFTSVTVGNPTYKDKAGNAVTKQGDKYFDAQGNEVKPEDVTAQAGEAVKLVSEKATPATNNQNANAPTTALNITSADGKPTQIKGVGSVLNTQNVATSTGTQGTTPAVPGVDKLVNLGTPTAPLAEAILNSAATVRDLANMGWVVSASDNGYINTVKNANQVNFKGENGISVTGKDGENGVRDITVSLKTGSVDGKGDGSATGDKGFVTGEQVANAINKSGWNLAANGTAGSEQINPTETVTFDAGKNMEVKRDGANITYATKDDVEFNSVHVGNPTYADENGAPVTKQGDKYFDKDGKEVAADTVVANPSVKMTAEKATPATNNQADAPTTALNVTSADGKPTQIKGVGSVLDTQTVPTSTGKQGETPAVAGTKNLVNLGTDPVTGESSLPDTTLNSAATVRDLANMGWVVSTEDGNGYVDTVKNANHVDFKGEGLAAVTGKTLADGTRQITVSVKTGEVTPTEATLKDDPTTKVVKVGDKYYKTTDVDLATGKVNTGAAEIPADQVVNNPNAGTGLVTGNQVGDAIQRSGFVIGKQDNMLAAADYQNKDERVNPDDNVRFADGNNTNVKLATKESIDASGKVVTTTTVKVDVVGLPVQYTTADGTPVTKVGDKFYKVDAAGNPTAETVEPSELVTNMINPTAAPNTTGDAVALGNVKGNLQGAAPQTTSPVDSAIAPTNVNANNAATVGDVLNAGFNLQNNGEARDFVKPYDTVNFVNGQGTKAVVTTDANNQISDVKVDIDTGTLTNNADGTVNGVTDAATATQLAKDLDDARTTLANLPANAPVNVVNAAKAAVLDAEKAADAAGLNKVATVQNVAEAINKSGFTLKTSATTEGAKDTASTGDELINPGKSVEMVAGKNMTVKQEASGKVTYSTKDDVNFNSVQFGNNGPTIQAGNDQYGSNIQVSNANGGPTRITNVAAGINDTDAVNVSQLRGVDNKVNNIQGQVNKLGKRMNAGVAGAMAAANLMQPHKPGQSALTAAVGQHRNQAAVAAGYSRLSDNGKYGIKLSFGANTQGEVSSGAGVAYFW